MSEYIIDYEWICKYEQNIEELLGHELHYDSATNPTPPLHLLVRCRDCIYYKQDPDPIDPGWPMMCERTGDDMVEPYGFCAWGTKKEDE